MRNLPVLLVGISAIVLAATWIGYPLWLHLRCRSLPRRPSGATHTSWPTVTIVVVVRNAERWLHDLLQSLLSLAYPTELRRILVVSNASDDFTDAVATSFANRGVELVRVMRQRRSAAAAENLARRYVNSELVVIVHPAARPRPSALAALVAPFADRTVGVAYGREVAARPAGEGAAIKESFYRRYEGWLRDHETRVFGTVSARRALYAVRGDLYRAPVPATLSPDFAPVLSAREQGYRGVYVGNAECLLAQPRTLRGTYARTVQTMARDVATLLLKPHLMNPRRYGAFAWILLGHKLGPWLSSWAVLGGLVGLAVLAPSYLWARAALALAVLPALASSAAWLLPGTTTPQPTAPLPVRVAAAMVANAHAWVKALRALPDFPFEPVPRPVFRMRF
jgi:hypothetical protein